MSSKVPKREVQREMRKAGSLQRAMRRNGWRISATGKVRKRPSW